MSILYIALVQWYCEDCGDEGESESQGGAEKQAAAHECTADQEART